MTEKNGRSRFGQRNRGQIVWLAVMLGATAIAAGCAKTEPVGKCINPSDTTIVREDVTQQQCIDVCPSCTWEAGGN